MESNQNVTCGADLHAEHPPINRKRRRTVVEAVPTESLPYSLCDPYVQTLFSEHAHTYATPPWPRAAVHTTGQSHGGELGRPSSTISQSEKRDAASSTRARPDSVHASDNHGAFPNSPGLAAPLPDASPCGYHGARRVSPSMLDKQHGRESFDEFGRSPGSHSTHLRRTAVICSRPG